MAILTKPATITKGSPATFSLSKSELAQHPLVVADSYFSDSLNWFRVNVVFKSSTGRQYETVEFDASQANPTGIFLISDKAKSNFEVLSVEILDFDGGILRIGREDLTTADFDINLEVIVNPPTIESFSTTLRLVEKTALSNFNNTMSWTGSGYGAYHTNNEISLSSTGKFYKEFIFKANDNFGSAYSRSFGVRILSNPPMDFSDASGTFKDFSDTQLNVFYLRSSNRLRYAVNAGQTLVNVPNVYTNTTVALDVVDTRFGIAIDFTNPEKRIDIHINGVWMFSTNIATSLTGPSLIALGATLSQKLYFTLFGMIGSQMEVATDPQFTPAGFTEV
jgi:hypothetical protein